MRDGGAAIGQVLHGAHGVGQLDGEPQRPGATDHGESGLQGAQRHGLASSGDRSAAGDDQVVQVGRQCPPSGDTTVPVQRVEGRVRSSRGEVCAVSMLVGRRFAHVVQALSRVLLHGDQGREAVLVHDSEEALLDQTLNHIEGTRCRPHRARRRPRRA